MKSKVIILLESAVLENREHILEIFVLIFSLFKTVFFLLNFLFSIKWLKLWTFKSLNISICTVTKNQVLLKLLSDHLKTKKCVSMQLTNYLIY